MGIIKFIESVCVQTAVYWPAPTPDGFGGMTYDNPYEVSVRWTDKTEVISDGKGNEIISKAEILTPSVLQEQGVLWLGHIDDLDSADMDDPRNLNKSYEIKRMDSTPLFRSVNEFVNTVYL